MIAQASLSIPAQTIGSALGLLFSDDQYDLSQIASAARLVNNPSGVQFGRLELLKARNWVDDEDIDQIGHTLAFIAKKTDSLYAVLETAHLVTQYLEMPLIDGVPIFRGEALKYPSFPSLLKNIEDVVANREGIAYFKAAYELLGDFSASHPFDARELTSDHPAAEELKGRDAKFRTALGGMASSPAKARQEYMRFGGEQEVLESQLQRVEYARQLVKFGQDAGELARQNEPNNPNDDLPFKYAKQSHDDAILALKKSPISESSIRSAINTIAYVVYHADPKGTQELQQVTQASHIVAQAYLEPLPTNAPATSSIKIQLSYSLETELHGDKRIAVEAMKHSAGVMYAHHAAVVLY